MKALLRTLLPGSASSRSVDDMIDNNNNRKPNNNNNNKDDQQQQQTPNNNNKKKRTKSLFSSSSQLPSSSRTTTIHNRVSSNTTGCLDDYKPNNEESDTDDDDNDSENYYSRDQARSSTANLPTLSLNNTNTNNHTTALSSSFSSQDNHHQYFNTNLSKQTSNSSVLSSSSIGGDSALQTRSSPNVMQHSPRQQQHVQQQQQQQNIPPHNNSNSSNNNNGIVGTPTNNNKRRSSLSNALRRLSLKKGSTPATTAIGGGGQQHSDLIGAGVINFADLMMSQSSSNNNNNNYTSSSNSIPITSTSGGGGQSSTSYNNYGSSFTSSNSILSSPTASINYNNNINNNNTNNNNMLMNHHSDQLLFTPNSPPTSPLSPLSFSTATLHNNNQTQQHTLAAFTATPNWEQQTTPNTPSSATSSNNNNNSNGSKRKSLNVITTGLSSHNIPSSTTTPSAQQQHQQQQYYNNNTIGASSSYCSPSNFEPHSPSMMLMMASQASPLLNTSNNSSHHHQQYYSVGTPSSSSNDRSFIFSSPLSERTTTMGQSQRATGTQQLLDVFVNRRKWRELLCVTAIAPNNNHHTTTNNNNTSGGCICMTTANTTTTTNSENNKSALASSPLSPEVMSIISSTINSTTTTTTTTDNDQVIDDNETDEGSYAINSTTTTTTTCSPGNLPLSSQPQPQIVAVIEEDGNFKISNSPNENVFRTIVLGGFLSYKEVLKCDLVCRSWHLRISHSKDNFIYFLPQLLSTISVWEEKDELQFMLATQIARNLSHLEMSKRMLMVLFGLYRRSLHKEKIFTRAVFKEVLRSEVPDLLGLTDKANMFYKLTSPTWFSPYSEHFQCPIYLYLAKRSLRFVEKVDGEFQQRVQVLLKIKYNYDQQDILPSSSQSAFLTTVVAGSSGANSICASPTQSPNITPTPTSRKLSVVAATASSPLIRSSLDPRGGISGISGGGSDTSPDRPTAEHNPPSSPLLVNGNFSTSTSPSAKQQLAQQQNTLADMINEIKTCWFFAYGVIDDKQSDMQDRVYPTPGASSSPNSQPHHHVVTSAHHHHHEKPALVHEKIIKFFSQFSLAQMKNEVVFPEEEDCPSPMPFSISKASERTNKISSNIEHCYHEMIHFRNNPQREYPSIKLAESELCHQFNNTMSKWVCELQKLGLYQLEFVLQYVFKLLFYICTGPMYDRSELYFGVVSLHDDDEMVVVENDQLETICTDPDSSRELLKQWIIDYRNQHSDCHIYHYYLKIKYECSGFTGGCDEESYLLTLKVKPDFSNFEFVSYLFESRYCKGMAISSLPLFIKKM